MTSAKELPDEIYLIRQGDEVVWCEHPDPAPDVEPEDVTKYVKAAEIAKLKEAEKLLMMMIKDIYKRYL